MRTDVKKPAGSFNFTRRVLMIFSTFSFNHDLRHWLRRID